MAQGRGSDAQAEMGFKMMDKDGSGCIDLKEYMDLVGGMMEHLDSAMGGMPAMEGMPATPAMPAMEGMPATPAMPAMDGMPAMEMPAMDMESMM